MRQKLLTLVLEQQWRCQFFRSADDIDETQNTAIIMSLSVWSADPGRPAATLDRTFVIKPMDECVSYWLLIDRAPRGTKILINHKQIVEYRGDDAEYPFELDITNYVMLGVNWIMFRVDAASPEGFQNVRLIATPCE